MMRAMMRAAGCVVVVVVVAVAMVLILVPVLVLVLVLVLFLFLFLACHAMPCHAILICSTSYLPTHLYKIKGQDGRMRCCVCWIVQCSAVQCCLVLWLLLRERDIQPCVPS